MAASVSRYSATSGPRQGQTIFVFAILLGVSGCSSFQLPLGGGGGDATEVEATGSVPPRAAASPRDAATGDWDVVASRITGRGTPAMPTTWTNTATAHTGTVTRVTETKALNGAPCRDFATTVERIGGVDLYEGRLCKGFTGSWELVSIAPAAGSASAAPGTGTATAGPGTTANAAAKTPAAGARPPAAATTID